MRKVLTIAGSDSSAGAGIQRDLKTFFDLGVFGATAITALTAQNNKKVLGVQAIPADFVGLQIDSVMEEGDCRVWKTGMLAKSDLVSVVAKKAAQYKSTLIVDPVMISGSGTRLLEKDAVTILIKKLLPHTFLITPNVPEAEVLANQKIKSVSDMKIAAKAIHKMGPKYVVIKGGHLDIPRHPGKRSASRIKNGFWTSQNDDAVIDILYDGKRFYEFSAKRVVVKNTHGTGCTFSAAITAEIVKGKSVKSAVGSAKEYVRKTFFTNYNL